MKIQVAKGRLEPRKRKALDNSIYWCVFDSQECKWSTLTCFGRYKTKKAAQYDILQLEQGIWPS